MFNTDMRYDIAKLGLADVQRRAHHRAMNEAAARDLHAARRNRRLARRAARKKP